MSDTGSDSFRSTLSGGCDYYFDNACDQCESEGRNVEAKGYCSTCSAYLCQECYTTHLRPKTMRHHVLLDENQMPDKVHAAPIPLKESSRILVIYPKEATQHTTGDRHVMDISVRTAKDRDTPDITSSVLLPGGKLVIVDANNIKVKLVELAYIKITAELTLALWISDMTKINDNKVAVMSSKKNLIYVVSVANELTLDNIVDIKGQCKGIACINGNFVLSFDDPARVELVSNTGQPMQVLVSDPYGQLLIQPRHIAVDYNRQIFYVSDLGWDTVTRLNYPCTKSTEKVYKNWNLTSPHKLAINKNGYVFACGYESNNIHKLTGDLSNGEIVLEKADGVTRPQTISYCDVTGRLYIGMWRSDILKVYQLKK